MIEAIVILGITDLLMCNCWKWEIVILRIIVYWYVIVRASVDKWVQVSNKFICNAEIKVSLLYLSILEIELWTIIIHKDSVKCPLIVVW